MSNLPHPFNDRDYPGMIFMAEYSMHCQATLLWIARRKIIGHDSTTERARIVWEETNPCDMPEPTLTVRDRDSYRGTSQLQFLFNALWDLGFRPPGSAPSGEVIGAMGETIAAKDQNMDDLRKLLFNQLGIPQGN